jgi:hypothetical protein
MSEAVSDTQPLITNVMFAGDTGDVKKENSTKSDACGRRCWQSVSTWIIMLASMASIVVVVILLTASEGVYQNTQDLEVLFSLPCEGIAGLGDFLAGGLRKKSSDEYSLELKWRSRIGADFTFDRTHTCNASTVYLCTAKGVVPSGPPVKVCAPETDGMAIPNPPLSMCIKVVQSGTEEDDDLDSMYGAEIPLTLNDIQTIYGSTANFPSCGVDCGLDMGLAEMYLAIRSSVTSYTVMRTARIWA